MAKKFKKMTKKEVAKEMATLKAEVAGLKTEMALKAEVAGLKTEMAHLRAEQRATLKAEIDNLHKRLHAEFEQAKQRSKRGEREAKGKVQALEEKAAKAQGEAKAAIEARMTNIRNRSKKSATSSQPPQESKVSSP
jgi:molecular chaperone GrpE (heat shock protein)